MEKEILTKMFQELSNVRKLAYAPYSNFKVAACILSEKGNYYFGVNIENAAYPQGWCAEASAISSLIMAGEKEIKEIGVMGEGNNLCTPCGGCRQKIREFASLDAKIHIFNQEGYQKTFTLEEILPSSFGPNNLKSIN